MATPEEQLKWKFQTKFRMLPMDFAKLRSGNKICEIEEVIVGSKDLSFEDYVQLRMIGFTLWMTNKGILYSSLIKFLRQQKIDVADLFFKMVQNQKNAPIIIQNIYEKFREATINELYDSPEEILSQIQNDEEFQKLIDEKAAIKMAMNDKSFLQKIKVQKSLYGNGTSSKKIIRILETINLDKIPIQKKLTY